MVKDLPLLWFPFQQKNFTYNYNETPNPLFFLHQWPGNYRNLFPHAFVHGGKIEFQLCERLDEYALNVYMGGGSWGKWIDHFSVKGKYYLVRNIIGTFCRVTQPHKNKWIIGMCFSSITNIRYSEPLDITAISQS